MTLAAKNKLINDMIRENPDVTIKDYLELVNDIDGIGHELNKVFFLKKLNQEVKEISKTMNKRFENRYNQIRP